MKNKYNLGDKVWVIIENKIERKEITGMVLLEYSMLNNGYTSPLEEKYKEYIAYTFPKNTHKQYGSIYTLTYIPEEKVFSTKEELIESLK